MFTRRRWHAGGWTHDDDTPGDDGARVHEVVGAVARGEGDETEEGVECTQEDDQVPDWAGAARGRDGRGQSSVRLRGMTAGGDGGEDSQAQA